MIGIEKIKENKKEHILIICETLIKITQNIIQYPDDLNKRKVYLDSNDVLNNLMPYSGGLEVLFEMGFQEL